MPLFALYIEELGNLVFAGFKITVTQMSNVFYVRI